MSVFYYSFLWEKKKQHEFARFYTIVLVQPICFFSTFSSAVFRSGFFMFLNRQSNDFVMFALIFCVAPRRKCNRFSFHTNFLLDPDQRFRATYLSSLKHLTRAEIMWFQMIESINYHKQKRMNLKLSLIGRREKLYQTERNGLGRNEKIEFLCDNEKW